MTPDTTGSFQALFSTPPCSRLDMPRASRLKVLHIIALQDIPGPMPSKLGHCQAGFLLKHVGTQPLVIANLTTQAMPMPRLPHKQYIPQLSDIAPRS